MRLFLGAAPLCAVLYLLPGSALNAQAAPDTTPAPLAAEEATPGSAIAPAEIPAPQPQAATPSEGEQRPDQKIDKRILGVLPNYRTANGFVPYSPITWEQKMIISFKDSFDYPVYFVSGGFAALYQLDNQNPSYGQGLKGYARRYGAAYGDQAIGNLMTEGIVPALIRQDPRYFRMGAASGHSKTYRTLYALRGVMWAKDDNGKWDFNYSEWVGNAAAVAISNLYYPDDTRDVHDNIQKLLVQVATDAFSNCLKEFWPDIKQKYFHKKKPVTSN